MNEYNIIAIVGESGTGKDTVLKSLRSLPIDYNAIVSCTTRPIRAGETPGVDYYYLTDEEYNRMEFLETSEFNNWRYGTGLKSVVKDKVNVGVFNPEGIDNLMYSPYINKLVIIRLRTPAHERLLRQLTRTENPDTAEIVRRFRTDEEDFKEFDTRFKDSYIVLSNNLPLDLEIARVEIAKQIQLMNN